MPEGAKLCGYCGTALIESKPPSMVTETSASQPTLEKQEASSPITTPKKKRGKLKLCLALAALLIILVGGGLAFAYTQDLLPENLTDSIAVVVPQGLTEDMVEQSLQDAGFESRTFAANHAWDEEGSDDALAPISLQEGSYTIDSIEDVEIHENEDGNTASVNARITLSNDYLVATIDVSAAYRRVDGRWILRDDNVESVSFSPLAAIDESVITARVQSYLAVFDGEQVTPSSGWGWSSTDDSDPTLASLYAGGDFSTTAELSHLDNGNYSTVAEVVLENETHFYTVSGTLSIIYRFDSETAQWTLARNDMQLSDSAWNPDYSKLVGTWEGTFHSSTSTHDRCLGGSEIRPLFVIQSIDIQNKALTATLSGLSHNHDCPRRTVNSVDGDIAFPATQLIADINVGASSITFDRVTVISSSSRFGVVEFSGNLEFVDGSMQGTIRSSGTASWFIFNDTYDFRKVD